MTTSLVSSLSRRASRIVSATAALVAGLAATLPPAWAADADLDALSLQSAPPAEAPPPAARRLFVEAYAGAAEQRYGLGSRGLARLSLDARDAGTLGGAWRYTLSARLDATDPRDPRVDNPVLSLREAYAGWQDDAAATLLDLGRINLRNGPAYGYNPTDFFRDRALRTVTTVNPFSLRESRLGVFMLRGQRLWADGSLTLALAPKLASASSNRGLRADWGATNDRERALATLSTRWGEAFSSQLLLYKEARTGARWGASATALLSDAITAHAEWTRSREPDLLSRALAMPGAAVSADRAALGLTYTTATRLSLTAELQHNGFALRRDALRGLSALGPAAPVAYFTAAQALQDNAGREAVLLYATQRDLFLKNLELTALARLNRTDHSRLYWLDLRYRLDKIDWALQVQRHAGEALSEFGILPVRGSVGLVATAYF